jgi:hypothetical protein
VTTSATSPSRHSSSDDTNDGARKAYLSVIGLAGVVILFQGLWAGLFIHEGKDYEQKWVDVHARGADLAILLTVIAAVILVVKLRHRTDLIIGTVAMAVILVLEAYLGGLIGNNSGLTAIHFPLAMALVGLAVWLPLRARA